MTFLTTNFYWFTNWLVSLEGTDLFPIVRIAPENKTGLIDQISLICRFIVQRRVSLRHALPHWFLAFETGMGRSNYRNAGISLNYNHCSWPTLKNFGVMKPAMAIFGSYLKRGIIEAINYHQGYTLEWGGEYESSTDAQSKHIQAVCLWVTCLCFIYYFCCSTSNSCTLTNFGVCVPLALNWCVSTGCS